MKRKSKWIRWWTVEGFYGGASCLHEARFMHVFVVMRGGKRRWEPNGFTFFLN